MVSRNRSQQAGERSAACNCWRVWALSSYVGDSETTAAAYQQVCREDGNICPLRSIWSFDRRTKFLRAMNSARQEQQLRQWTNC
jgi:hypothetical protein